MKIKIILFLTIILACFAVVLHGETVDEMYKQAMKHLFKVKIITNVQNLSHPDIKEALMLFNQIMQEHPKTKWAKRSCQHIAITHYKAKNYKKAEEIFNKLIADYPDSGSVIDWQIVLAKIAFDKKEYNQAKKKLQEIIEPIEENKNLSIHQNKVPAITIHSSRIMIAECSLNAGQFQEAIDAFQQFIIDYPESLIIAEAFTGMAKAYYIQGNKSYEAKDYNKALTFYNETIKIYEGKREEYILTEELFQDVYLMKAEALIEMGKKEEAKKPLEYLKNTYGFLPVGIKAKKRLEELQ